MPKPRSARSGSPRKKQVPEDRTKGLDSQFDITARRRVFSEARTRFSQLSTDAGVGGMPGWLSDLRQEHQAIAEETSPTNRSLKSAAGIVRMSVRHTMQERSIAATMLGGGGIHKGDMIAEKAKVEAVLNRLEKAVGVDAQNQTPAMDLRHTFEELQHSLDPTAFARSIEEIRIMIDRLHALEATFDEIAVNATMAKITESLENLKRQVPDIISHVRNETERNWAKTRHVRNAHLFTSRTQRLARDNRQIVNENQAATIDVPEEEERSKSDKQKAMVKMALSSSESWSKIADESALLKRRGPDSRTWLTWWPDRDPEGYNQERQTQFFDSLPPDMLSQQEEDLRDAIFKIFAQDEKKTWPSLEEVAKDEHVRLCVHRCLPEFASLEDWILKRRHIGQHSSHDSPATPTVQRSPRLTSILQPGWSKIDTHDEEAAATTSPRRTLRPEGPVSARQATMQRAKTRRALGLQVAVSEEGDSCCALDGTKHLPSITKRVQQQKSFSWIKALEETQHMARMPTPAGLPTVEEVVAWRVSHKYRRREVDPCLVKMWQTYDTIIDPEHMHQCPCEKCLGRLNYEIPSSSPDLFS